MKFGRRVDQSRIVMRECQTYSIDPGQCLRHDFAYTDPASGWQYQYAVEHWFSHDREPLEEQLVEARVVARNIIARVLERKCGDAWRPPSWPLELPRTVPSRWV